MPAPFLIAGASLLFALMGVCVKFASARYGPGEIVFYRSLVTLVATAWLLRRGGGTVRTAVPAMHFWRSVSGVAALCLWFYAISRLPLATGMTLNYMSSVWMALFLMGGAALTGSGRIDGRLVASVMAGFAGVALVLRPTIDQQQAWHGLAGLASGVLSAVAYLNVRALGRAGEPEQRVVFYFSLGGVVAGTGVALLAGGFAGHDARGLALLLATGVLGTAAQLMMTRAYAIGQTLSNATLQYLGILFSFVFGVWLFGDPVSWGAVAGIVLIVGAGLTATLISLRSHTPAAATPTEG
ncbi:MAG: DMT family transporter [Rubrivivax sp.]